MKLKVAVFGLLAAVSIQVSRQAHAEDGYDLWLRYRPIADEPLRERYRQAASARGGANP